MLSFLYDFLVFFSLFVIVFGLLGNFCVFKIYFSSKLRKNTLSLYFQAMSLIDSFMLIQMLNQSMLIYFGWDIRFQSDFTCKTTYYTSFSFGPMVAWMLVIISIDRFVNIAFPKKFSFLFRKEFQLFLIIFIIAFNLGFYSFMVWNSHIVVLDNITDPITNQTILQVDCINDAQQTLVWMDLFNSTILPFAAMIMFTFLLIFFIKRSRNRIRTNSLLVDRQKTKDRKFTVTALTLNIVFLVLNVPILINNFFGIYNLNMSDDFRNTFFFICITLYYTFFGMDFYAQFLSNSIFRDRFMAILNLKLSKLHTDGNTTHGGTSMTNSITNQQNNHGSPIN